MNKKKLYWGVGLVAIIFLVWWGFRTWQNEAIFKKYQAGGEKALTSDEWAKFEGIIVEKYKADTYGSTTPEGTLELFVDALKKGDAELAAKYFVPEKKESQQKTFENWIRLDKNTEIAGIYNKATDGSENVRGYYLLTVYEEDGKNMQIVLLKNNYSGKWKIQSL